MQPTLEDGPGGPTEDVEAAFRAAWALARDVPGWLTEAQGRALFHAARQCPPGGTIVEIGSHQGRSTIVLAGARPDVRVVAVDPHLAGGRYGGRETAARFREHLRRAGVAERVVHLERTSAEARREWSGPVDVLYIDGKHDYWTVRDDLRWVGFVPAGGAVLLHDVLGSFGVTLAVLRDLLGPSSIGFVGRWGSLARFTPGPATPAQRRALLAGLPWFGRNLGIKVLLRLRLHGLARLAGHDGPDDPF